MTVTGTVYFGPCLHFWYSKLLPRIVSKFLPASEVSLSTALLGMAFDQLAFAPLVLSGFFIFLNFTKEPEMKGIKVGVEEVRGKIWETLKTNWCIWPFATLTNLYFVPNRYQVLFANFVGLFWNMYLSFQGSK
jgi:protein Mpv17